MELDRVRKILREHRSELDRFGVKSVSVFGSVARGEERPDSDVDLLVDFERAIDLFSFVDLQLHLERWLGRRVDLAARNSLKEALRETILREAVHAA